MHQVKLFIKSSVPFFSSASLGASRGQTNIATGAPGLQRVDKRQGQHLKTAEKHLQLYPKIVGFGQCFAQLFKPLIPLLPVQLQETFQKRCDTGNTFIPHGDTFMPHGDKAFWYPDCWYWQNNSEPGHYSSRKPNEGCAALALAATPLLMSLIGSLKAKNKTQTAQARKAGSGHHFWPPSWHKQGKEGPNLCCLIKRSHHTNWLCSCKCCVYTETSPIPLAGAGADTIKSHI